MKSIEKLRKCVDKQRYEYNNHNVSFVWQLSTIADEIEAEIAANYLELPVDADGNRVKFGDKLHEDEDGHEFVVSGFKVWGDSFEWWAYQENGVQAPLERCHIVKPDPLNELLTEMLDRNSDGVGLREFNRDFGAFVAHYADEIRELLGGDAE